MNANSAKIRLSCNSVDINVTDLFLAYVLLLFQIPNSASYTKLGCPSHLEQSQIKGIV